MNHFQNLAFWGHITKFDPKINSLIFNRANGGENKLQVFIGHERSKFYGINAKNFAGSYNIIKKYYKIGKQKYAHIIPSYQQFKI